MNIDDKLTEIVTYCSESYYPEHEYGAMNADQNKEYVRDAVAAIKQAFHDANYYQLTDDQRKALAVMHSLEGADQLLSGKEWFRRFYQELSADDIDLDHEEDVLETPQVLLAARRAAGMDDKKVVDK